MTLTTGPFVSGPFSSGPFVSGPFGTRYGGPSLDLNFMAIAAIQTLDSRITFTRASNATMFDSQGRLVWAPANMVAGGSNDMTVAGWTKSGTSAASFTGPASPVFNTSSVVTGATTATWGSANSIRAGYSSLVSGASYTWSVYVRSAGATTVTVNDRDQSTGNEVATTQSLTPGVWHRLSRSRTLGAATTAIGLIIGATDGDILVGGWQIEPTGVDSPKPYVLAALVAVYGPRLDYNPATLTARGLLVEEARTNLVLVSEDLTNAAVNKTLVTINGSTTAPSGLTANRVQEDTSLGEHYTGRETVTTVAATAYTGSVFCKADQRSRVAVNFRCNTGGDTATALFDLATGLQVGAVIVTGGVTNGSATIQSVGNGWYRCTLTATTDGGTATSLRIKLDNGATTSYTGDGASGLYVWGLQLELGAFAASYIPTFGTAATRTAESAVMTGANFSSWFNAANGTFACDYIRALQTPSLANQPFTVSDNTLNNRVQSQIAPIGTLALVHRSAGNNYDYGGGGSATALGALGKFAVTYQTLGARRTQNGDAIQANGAALAPVGVDRLYIGANAPGVVTGYGWISRVRYWPHADFTDAQLQALST